jgi:hypothetical protein
MSEENFEGEQEFRHNHQTALHKHHSDKNYLSLFASLAIDFQLFHKPGFK